MNVFGSHSCRRYPLFRYSLAFLLALCLPAAHAQTKQLVDLTPAVVAVDPGTLPNAVQKASEVLVEEIQARTGVTWTVTDTMPGSGTVISLDEQTGYPGLTEEGYRLYVDTGTPGLTVVRVIGADPRGVLFGAGKLLRTVEWSTGSVSLDSSTDVTTSPAYLLRGHQIGYRNLANSYDAWDVAQYEQYIRELVIFGANCIENIPFEAAGSSVHFSVTPEVMNANLSQICDDYDIDYWVWTPATGNLADGSYYSGLLAQHEALYQNCVRLDGVFVPGGDPGGNPPALVMDFVEDIAGLLATYHPDAGVWVSNQGFGHSDNDWFFNYLQTQQPSWLAGVVFGPWAKLSIAEMRQRTPSQYPVRRYPDITHSVRCQYPVPDWDRAYAHTLGREPINPRPVGTAQIHNAFAQHAAGFLAYSDGAHDDVNKMVWSMRGWDPTAMPEEMMLDYARFFFGPGVAQDTADGILALEQNWTGPLATNTSVDTTWADWNALETANPGLAGNWRWQSFLLRAYYDYYIRERLAYETGLEAAANADLADAPSRGANTAMNDAEAELLLAETATVRADLQTRISDLCADLFTSVGLQTSVYSPYFAKSLERGCVLDTMNWSINNRWWLENRFDDIRLLGSEAAKLDAIDEILNWEDPGPGGFYDDLGNPTEQPHLVQQKTWADDPGRVESTNNSFQWHNGDTVNLFKGGGRLSWQDMAETLFGTALEMQYTGLDPGAVYTLRILYTGRYRPIMTLTANGTHPVHGALGQPDPPTVLECVLPQYVTMDGTLHLQWDLIDGRGCQVGEVWLTPTYPTVRYVDADASGSGTGDSWANAFTTIQAAVNAASAGDVVWVADGTYTSPVTLASGVRVYGGFTGVETQFSGRDAAVHRTVLDVSTADGGGPADHAIVIQGVTGAWVDGLWITGADANGTDPDDSGGGVYFSNADGTNGISGCWIFGNHAVNHGAGVHCMSSSPLILDCVIGGNAADDDGGGIYGNQSSPYISGCIIGGNESGDFGGGVAHYTTSSPALVNTVIRGNRASRAGAMRYSSSNGTMTNCTLVSNSSDPLGYDLYGGVHLGGSSPVFTNTMFVGHPHQAFYEGSSDSDPVLNHCLFFDNPDGDYYDDDTASVHTGTAAIEANVPQASGIAEGNPRLLSGPAGTWSTVSYDGGANRSTLTASQAVFTSDALIGRFINTNTAQYFECFIVANDTVSVQVVGDVTGIAGPGSNFAVADHHVPRDSGALDVGTDASAPDADADGEPRPFDAAYDIGADEFYDSDGDGLADVVETGTGTYRGPYDTGTSATNADHDGDGIGDGVEVALGSDPTSSVSVPSLGEVWVDFAYTGFELGTVQQPFDTFGEGVIVVTPGGTVRIKGDTAQNASDETPRVTKSLRAEAVNGSVRMGEEPAPGAVPGGARSWLTELLRTLRK